MSQYDPLPREVPLKRPPNPSTRDAANSGQPAVTANSSQPAATTNSGQPPTNGHPPSLIQRTNRLIAATPDPAQNNPYPKNLADLVNAKSLYNSAKPDEPQVVKIKLGKYKGMNRDQNFPDLKGGNQGGLAPVGNRVDKPETADYTERRPEQLLSHISAVMMHQAREAGLNPTEVQFGYVHNTTNGDVKIYSSTNDRKSQDWLNKALADPLKYVKAAATQNGDKDVQRNALKLLFFDESQKHRRGENLKIADTDPERSKRIDEDLNLADKIHQQIFTGTHRVVKNDRGGMSEGRHAEQNVAEAMHQEKEAGQAEIAGTKIRCFSCSASIGPNLIHDGHYGEPVYIGGKGYLAQSDKKSQRDLTSGLNSTREGAKWIDGQKDPEGPGRTSFYGGNPKRPRSPSPPRGLEEDQAGDGTKGTSPEKKQKLEDQ
jgi:hypothetical protein